MILPVGKHLVYIPRSTRTSTSSEVSSTKTSPEIPAIIGIPVGLIFIGLTLAGLKMWWEERGYCSIIATIIAMPIVFLLLLAGLFFILAPFCEKCGGI